MVTESDGYSHIQFAPSTVAAETAAPSDEPLQKPVESRRFPLKPWMVAAILCLVLGTGIGGSIYLALNPPSLPPVAEESSDNTIASATTPRTLSTRDREVSSLYTPLKIIESYYEGDAAIQIYAEEHLDEEGVVTELRGVMDGNDHILIPAAYKTISPLTPDRFVVRSSEDKWGLINLKNEVLYPLEADCIEYRAQQKDKSANIMLVEKNQQWSMVNYDGKTMGDTTWDYLDYFDKAFLAISGEKAFVVNYFGKVTIELPTTPVFYESYFDGVFNLVHRFGKNGQTFGLQDRDGGTILPADYHELIVLSPNRIIGKKWMSAKSMYSYNAKACLFNEKGEQLTGMDYNDLQPIQSKKGDYKIFVAQSHELAEDGSYTPQHYLLDANGNKIFSQGYDSYAIREGKGQIVLYKNRESTTVDFEGNLISAS